MIARRHEECIDELGVEFAINCDWYFPSFF